MQVIYVDTLFIINLVVNYLILLATAKISAVQVSRLRIAAGALLGAAYGVLAVFPQWEFFTALPMKAVAGAFMVLIVFGGKQGIFRLAVIFFAVSAGFGGIIYAVSLAAGGGSISASGVYLPVSLKALLVSFALCYGILTLVFSRMGRDTGGRIISVELSHRGKSAVFFALVDTGNSLRDPVAGGGVVVAEIDAVKALFSPEIVKCITGPGDPIELMEKLKDIPEGIGFYLLPYTAIGASGAFLLAFRPQSVRIDGKEEKGTSVALSPTRVSDGGRYQALVNGGVL